MKVILQQDVKNIGRKYEIKDVNDGHALNFLIPQKMAIVATDKSLSALEVIKAKDLQEKKIRQDLILKNIGELDGISITLVEKANDKGHLFAGIHKMEIIDVIKKQTRLDIEENWIVMEKPIKTTGEFFVEVKLPDAKKSAKFKLIVQATK